tara:strand:+ start:2380 stop:2802 length:423 start_codon:yes stop_codon:yes gene_type:complete
MSASQAFFSKQKALDQAVWLNFENRLRNNRFGAIQGVAGQYLVMPTDHPSFEGEAFETFPDSYESMDYEQIQGIAMDPEPLSFWEAILGMFSTIDGEVLRFILRYQVPLSKFIRFELAARGYDRDNRFCGFEQARKIWFE